MASRVETPKKAVKGRKPKEECANDFCRLCKCALKLKFWNFEKTTDVSSEQVFKPSTKSDKTLYEHVLDLNISLERTPALSERVCKSCGRKIRNASSLFVWIKAAINVLRSSQDENNNREKRQLPTAVDMRDWSTQARKQHKSTVLTKTTVSKRSLFPETRGNLQTDRVDEKENEHGTPNIPSVLATMPVNIDKLIHVKTTSMAKVVIVRPNGKVQQYHQFDKITKSLIVILSEKLENCREHCV